MEKKWIWSSVLILTIFVGGIYFSMRNNEKGAVSVVPSKHPLVRLEETTSSRSIEALDTEKSKSPEKKIDNLGAMTTALAIQDGEARTARLKEDFDRWCRSDPESATRWAAENSDLRLDSDTRNGFIFKGITLWADQGNAHDAADYAAAIPVEDPMLSSIGMALTIWTKKDPAAAKAYIDQMSDKSLQPQALRGLLSTLSTTDPLKAAQLSQQYGSEEDRATNSGVVVAEWATHDFDAAWRWANSLSGNSRGIAAFTMAVSFVDRDPQAASDWAGRLPDSAVRSDVIAATAFALAGKDQRAAADWIVALPPGKDRESAALSFIDNSSVKNPPVAADVAVSLADPAKRQAQLDAVLKPWLNTQPAQVKKWLTAHPGVSISP